MKADIAPPEAEQPARVRRNREPKPKRVIVDFGHVEAHHYGVHARLENWALTLRNPMVQACAPGFESYQSPASVKRDREIRTVDAGEGRRVGAAVILLPEPHRLAITWCYVKKSSPKRGCQMVACTPEALYRYIRDGRQMLLNRGA